MNFISDNVILCKKELIFHHSKIYLICNSSIDINLF